VVKWPGTGQPDGFAGKGLLFDLQKEAVFGFSLGFTERGDHCASWL